MPRRLLLLLALLLAAMPAAASESPPVVSDNITARLVTDAATAAPGQTVTLAFVQEIREGWHTYWRNPGDSGAPVTLDWDLPAGVALGPPQWPTPEAIPYFGLMTYGHHERFVLLHELAIPADWPAGQPLPIRLAADWLVCEEICIPESGTFALELAVDELPAGAAPLPAVPAIRELVAAARAQLPRPLAWPAAFQADDTTLRLEVALTAPLAALREARFFPYEPALIDQVAEPRWRLDGTAGLTLDLTLDRHEALAEPLEGVLVLTEELPDGPQQQAFTVAAPRDPAMTLAPLPAAATAGAGTAVGGLLAALPLAAPGLLELALLAFLGGLVLNLMPCVFPILSLKALALVRHAGSPRAVAHGLAYTLGVQATFLALAGLLLALQAGGALVGWGFQLQEPLVVAFLAYLVFTIGLWLLAGDSLMGGLARGLGRLMGLGQGLGATGTAGAEPGLGGSFATGVLAVFVASPCTAPFMAGAIGFALTRDAATTLAVFAALGLGLAFPYLALSAVPALQRRLPRPGPWMVRFRQLMAFPMLVTAAWLVWVLAQQTDAQALLLVLMGFVAIGFALWAFQQVGRLAQAGGIAALALALALGTLPATLSSQAPASQAPASQATATGAGDAAESTMAGASAPAERFSPERLAELRATGRPVFVNMTAAWCLTCIVNEKTVLDGAAFAATLARHDAVYMKGDWTRRDPAITAYLASFARAGVPLYVVYPATGEPVILPQILTGDLIENAFAAAAGDTAS